MIATRDSFSDLPTWQPQSYWSVEAQATWHGHGSTKMKISRLIFSCHIISVSTCTRVGSHGTGRIEAHGPFTRPDISRINIANFHPIRKKKQFHSCKHKLLIKNVNTSRMYPRPCLDQQYI